MWRAFQDRAQLQDAPSFRGLAIRQHDGLVRPWCRCGAVEIDEGG
jgi:hypothetical protein